MKSIQNQFSLKFAKIRALLFTPKFPKLHQIEGLEIQSLGSGYGRKFFCLIFGERPILVSGGVVEDISFDVELISNYGATVYLFDPTPRAILHIDQVRRRFGTSRNCSYSETGRQPANSYDLVNINNKNLILNEFALLESSKLVKFYEPPISDHVSYSVQNIQNHFKPKGPYIEVRALGPQEVIEITGTDRIDILKLDVEGSEYLYLSSSFKKGIFPDQVLIEIDELHFPSFRSRRIAKNIFKLFSAHDYTLVYIDGYNFTYLKNNSVYM